MTVMSEEQIRRLIDKFINLSLDFKRRDRNISSMIVDEQIKTLRVVIGDEHESSLFGK